MPSRDGSGEPAGAGLDHGCTAGAPPVHHGCATGAPPVHHPAPACRQLALDLATPEERANGMRKLLGPLELPERAKAVLCWLAARAETIAIHGQPGGRVTASKRSAAVEIGCSTRTFLRGVRDLEVLGVLAVVRLACPWTYVVSWHRLARRLSRLPSRADPVDQAVAELDLFAPEGGSPVVQGGAPVVHQGRTCGDEARESVNIQRSKVRAPCLRDPVDSVARGAGADEAAREARWEAPWHRRAGISDDDLRRAVIWRELENLMHAYWIAVELGWITATERSRLRFLTICHHAATCTGVGRRVGLLVARVKARLDVQRIPQASEDWAVEAIHDLERDPLLSRSREDDHVVSV